MKRKKVLIDLSNLSFVNCGFGQIALNYAKLFAEVQRSGKEDFDIVFMLPYSFRRKSLDEFKGLEYCFTQSKLHHIFKTIPNTLPSVDVWHAINQFCDTYPTDKNTKLIYTIHDLNFLFEEEATIVKRNIKMLQNRVDKSHCVTFISEFARDIAYRHLNIRNKDTRVIYNGVETLTGQPSTRPLFIKDDKPFFFTIGQFLEKKNFHLLVDVMKSFPDMHLYMCGDCHTEYGVKIIRRISLECIKNVTVISNLTNEERVWMYEHCRAYLFPSIGEGFGLPMIEAMQFGKPVFISNAQSLPEIGGGHAFIWDSLETEKMVQTIKDNLNRFESNLTNADKLKEYAATFSYKKHIENYLQLYRELLNQ